MRLPGAGALKALTRPIKRMIRTRAENLKRLIPEITPDEIAIIRRYQQFTMTSSERQWALMSALKHLNRAKIDGAVVECGVWRGGNMMIAREICRAAGINRKIYLFDTFAGMSEPTDEDVSHSNAAAKAEYGSRVNEDHADWSYASLDDVVRNFQQANLLDSSVTFIKGKVEETLRDPKNIPDQIALLRLDTDWYESTKVELEVLYPKLVRGGVLIIDDYGHWRGARKAVDDYFKNSSLLMIRIDYTARLVIKD
jgi:hypothetical protein